MRKIRITELKVSEINPAPYNPRAITEEAFEGLKASLQKFGMPEPLVVNGRGRVLVGGHQRLRAAQSLGWETVPVVLVDLSESEEKALNVTLNNPRIAGFFTDSLQDILGYLRADLGAEFAELKLDDLVIPDAWNEGADEVAAIEDNLDGIRATIKVKCPQGIKDDVLVILKRAFIETSLEGVEIV